MGVGKKIDDNVDVDLTPVMNLFVAMIPFLLLTAAFYHVAVVNSSVPMQSESDDSDLAKGKDEVTMSIQIDKDGFKTSASSATLSTSVLEGMAWNIPKKGSDYDYDKLAKNLYNVKRRYPESKAVILVPEDYVIYDAIVHTMDAVREIDHEDKKYQMFPTIIISELVR